jgi:23S rRNA pseudouridine1911/1915/1917 synthase
VRTIAFSFHPSAFILHPSMPALDVLYEDNHLLVLNKPAGLPTMGTPDGVPTLLMLAKDYIKEKYQKPGNVYLGVMSRLDAPVTGVVLLARTSKAAARMTEQFRTHAVQKIYWTLVAGTPHPASGSYTNWLIQDERHRLMHVVRAPGTPGRGCSGAKEARLAYRLLSSDGRMALLEVELETGRKHQIRLQMAHHGHPVVGDRKYGSQLKFSAGIALHARRLVVAHPVRGETLVFEAPLPKYWPQRKDEGGRMKDE